MKASAFSGLHKVTCPKCGGPFGPASVITSREMPRLTAIDGPSTNMQPWAEIFLDKRNGERLLAADQLSDDMGLNNFRMVLTDRRLIYLPSVSLTVNQSRIQDYYYKIIPLRRITSVKINKTLT
ncbi:MAG: hypothetical protein MUC85_11730, partial [Anaerolineales bacterium]|nr:hypothetical protein [Anaerolineales bacterium]